MLNIDVERFAGLNVCGFNPIEVFAEILSRCLGQKCLLFSIIKERYLIYPWKNFCISFENREKHKNLAQWIFPHLWYGSEPSSHDHKCDQMITIHKAFYKDFCKSFCYI